MLLSPCWPCGDTFSLGCRSHDDFIHSQKERLCHLGSVVPGPGMFPKDIHVLEAWTPAGSVYSRSEDGRSAQSSPRDHGALVKSSLSSLDWWKSTVQQSQDGGSFIGSHDHLRPHLHSTNDIPHLLPTAHHSRPLRVPLSFHG